MRMDEYEVVCLCCACVRVLAMVRRVVNDTSGARGP